MFVFPNRNPNKGVIINKPNGTNVYSGVPKDYTKQVMYMYAQDLSHFIIHIWVRILNDVQLGPDMG